MWSEERTMRRAWTVFGHGDLTVQLIFQLSCWLSALRRGINSEIVRYRAVARIYVLPRRRKLRPEWPKSESAGPRAGVGFLGGGQTAPPHQLGDLGSAVSSPSGIRPEPGPAAKRFSRVFGVFFGWRWSLPLPTNPVWWGSMHAISSYRCNRPTTNKQTHKQTHKQTGPITITLF